MAKSIDESIREHDIMTPLVVGRTSKNRYELIDGLTRIGCVPDDAEVPCIIIGDPGTHMIPKKQIRGERK